MLLNKNISTVKPSATLAINELVKKQRMAGNKVVHWGFGQSPFPVFRKITEQLNKHADDKNYLPGAGLAELRETISTFYQSKYGYRYQTDDVFIAPGSKETIFDLLYLLEGDLLLPAPSWVSYEPQAKLLGKSVHWIPTSFNNKYLLQPESFAAWCDKHLKTKQAILILNSPNNPSGQQYDADSLKALAPIFRKHNIIVISDEIYAGVSFSDKPYASIAHFYPEKTIVTGGLSKLFSAGGYRLGFSLIPNEMEALKKALLVLISETYSCVSSPIQYAALAAYQDDPELDNYLQQCNQCHQMIGQYIHKALTRFDVDCHASQGAFYLLPNFSKFKAKWQQLSIHDDKALCFYLLENYQLAMLPGSEFGMPAEAMTCRIATVDYDGAKALQATSIDADCFSNIRQGVEILSAVLSDR